MLHTRSLLSATVVAGLVATSTASAQFVNPNASQGASPFSGGRVTINTVPVYGGNVFYSPPFGGYNGYYGAVAPSVSSGGWTGNAPGYGGYGFAPFGYNAPLAPPMTMEDPIQQQQRIALNNSRYDLQTAQTAKAYAEANLFQAQAMATANQMGDPLQTPIRDKFNVRTMAPRSHRKTGAVAAKVPIDQLMTQQGQVKWPAAAPAGEGRDLVDAGTTALAEQVRATGKASVQAVNDARDSLYSYGLPALADVRKNSPADAAAFKDFLNNMDATLLSMAGK
jgi:hypothetical protein